MLTTPIYELVLPWMSSPYSVPGFELGEGEQALSIVAGFHGNETNGPLVASLLIRTLTHCESHLRRRVRLVPSANPLALDVSRRSLPLEEVDIYDSFGFTVPATSSERSAAAIRDFVQESQVVLDLHSSVPGVRVLPHVRYYLRRDTSRLGGVRQRSYRELADALRLPFALEKAYSAGQLPTSMRESPTVPSGIMTLCLERTFAERGSRSTAAVLMLGSAGWADRGQIMQVLVAVGRLLAFLGVLARGVFDEALVAAGVPMMLASGDWRLDAAAFGTYSTEDVSFVVSTHAGLFVPSSALGDVLKGGDVVGVLLSGWGSGEPEYLRAEVSGLLVALQSDPVVHAGSVVAQLLPMHSVTISTSDSI